LVIKNEDTTEFSFQQALSYTAFTLPKNVLI